MAILNNNPLVGASGNQGGYNINNSLRFRASASAYLSRTPASAGNRQIWTWSCWVKKTPLASGVQAMIAAGVSTTVYDDFCFENDQIRFVFNNGTYDVKTTQVFRDPSAWYHVIVAMDTTQATASNRVKIYVNGSQVTAFATANYPAQNHNTNINNNILNNIGNLYNGSFSSYFDGYMTEVNFIDGSAKTPSDFGETDTTTGVWKPKAYTGTYGTNGFYLKFSDIATTSGSNAGLGKDFSGNSNYWTTNNISVTSGTTYDAMKDVPTNTSATVANYAVLNPLDTGANTTISDGNLKYVTSSNAAVGTCRASMAFPTTGKWYFEVTAGSTANANTVGVANSSMNVTTGLGDNANGWGYSNDGYLYNNGTPTNTSTTWGNGDIAGIAFDADSGKLWFAKNNTWVLSGNPSSGTNPAFTGLTGTTFFPAVSDYGGGSTSNLVTNFGQRPFTYTPPTGYVALNTYNLPTPTILQGNKYMDATIWTGNGSSSRAITNVGSFKPDLVWVKDRGPTVENHWLTDSVRGATKYLSSNLTDSEYTFTTDVLSFDTGGFTVGSDGKVNRLNDTYVGWQWQAGQGSTSSNTSGSITSTVSVNTTAGFSVVTYTGTGANATVGHGLGVAPAMVIVKRRSGAEAWGVYHKSLGATQAINLELTVAAYTYAIAWNNTAPTSSTFSLGTWAAVNSSSGTFVAYCFAEIAGFSKFGSFTGNGSTDGPFVFTNFRPKYILIKNSSNVSNWVIFDTSRSPYNNFSADIYANISDAEYSGGINPDILSNGFKIRTSNSTWNGSGNTFIYMAFAENPFKNSLAR